MSASYIDDVIVTVLKSLTAVTDIVGSGVNAVIRPDRLRQSDELPAIIVSISEEVHQNSLDGRGGLVSANVIVTCRSAEKRVSRQLAEAVRFNSEDAGSELGTGLAGYSGNVLGFEIDCVLDSQRPHFTFIEDGNDEGVYDVDMEFTVQYSEDI